MPDVYDSRLAKMMKWMNGIPAGSCFGITTGPGTTHYSGTIDQVSDRLRRHEDCHKKQYLRYSTTAAFWAAYLAANIKHGYQNNPFEVEARKAEQ